MIHTEFSVGQEVHHVNSNGIFRIAQIREDGVVIDRHSKHGFFWPINTVRKFIQICIDFKECNNRTEVKKKYRELASKCHPDKGGTNSQFQELQRKYKNRLKEIYND
jgi:hypothetical protein